jgi:hypothetical protein
MMRSHAKIAAASLLVLGVGCGGTEAVPVEEGRAPNWPEELLTGEGSGRPALYLGAEPNSPAIGYVSPDVRVRIAGAPSGDRVPVHIEGPLKVRGWLALTRLSARVQARGRVDGTPTYLGPNDLVGVRGSGEGANLRVEVRPWLGRAETAATLGSFVGEFPGSSLGADEVDPATAEPPTPGEPHALPAGQEVPLYDRPGGSVIANIPALDPPVQVVVLRERGEWKGVRVGVGPYLIGYVNVELTAGGTLLMQALGPPSDELPPGPVPERLQADSERPLWRVPARTRVRFDRKIIAVTRDPGFAREIRRFPSGEVDVFVAVDDQVAVRGMVRVDDLEEYSGEGATPPAGETPAGETPADVPPPPPATDVPPPPPPPAATPPAPPPQGGLIRPGAQ